MSASTQVLYLTLEVQKISHTDKSNFFINCASAFILGKYCKIKAINAAIMSHAHHSSHELLGQTLAAKLTLYCYR